MWVGRAIVVALTVLLLTMFGHPPANAVVMWHPKAALLPTPWTKLVGPENALPDYPPRPQMRRASWMNLNGVWGYMGRSAGSVLPAPPAPSAYREQILVPYPVESALSGIERHDDEMWYRKVVRLPSNWVGGQHVLLHFGAVDQIATVWVNNQEVARHEGGYTEFSVDITRALHLPVPRRSPSALRTATTPIPFRSVSNAIDRRGLFYTGASGIWQTVWMEPVHATYINKVDISTSLTGMNVTPRIAGTKGQRAVVFVVKPDGGRVVAVGSAGAGDTIRLPVPEPHLWTPDDPYLYDLKVALVDPSGKVVDAVASYAGLRTIGTMPDAQGRPRIALNNRITFLHGPLDQGGYWPDGIYTAPTDDALKSDLLRIKDLGMNFVRKHGKVEPARWYYWADKLGGLMVWQDMPSLDVSLDIPVGPAPEPSPAAKANFEKKELLAMIDQLRSVTSIVGWVPFNEAGGENSTPPGSPASRRLRTPPLGWWTPTAGG